MIVMLPVALVFNLWSNSSNANDRLNVATDENSIDEIVIVAHKTERSLREVAANVTALSKDELNNALATNLDDAFRFTPGIDAENNGNRFGTEGINIRGLGGNRVAILIDGVPLSDQFAVGSFSNATRDFVSTGLVQRMEILHGPASALYGSSAIGGVLAVRTPNPDDVVAGENRAADITTTWRDSNDSLNATTLFAVDGGQQGFLLGASWQNGNEEKSAAVNNAIDTQDFTRGSVLLKYVFNTDAGNLWRTTLIHQGAEVNSDQNSVLGTGRFQSNTALEGDDRYQMDLLSLEYEFGNEMQWIDSGLLRTYYQLAKVQQSTLDERGLARTPVSINRYFEFDQKIQGFELNLQKQVHQQSWSHFLAFGIEYRGRRTEEFRDGLSTNLNDGTQTNVLLGEVFPLRDFPISDSSEWGLYLEDSVFIHNWTLIAGLRGDYYDLSPRKDSLYAEDYPFAEPVAVSVGDWSPKLGSVYHPSDDSDIYLQYTEGFRAPPYSDANIGLEVPLFNYRAIPNPDLVSETSKGLDVGWRQRGDQGEFHFGIFQTRYENFIESRRQIGTDPVSGRILFQSQNIRNATIEGVEAGGSMRFTGVLENFSINGGLYVARGDNGETSEPLNSVGPAQALAGITWQSSSERNVILLQTTFTSGWDDLDESAGELFKPRGNTLLDFFYTYRWSDEIILRASINNLTDRTYWRWSDVRGLSTDDPVLPYLAMPGRHYSLSVNMNWR